MDLFISLGMEMGSWTDNSGHYYYIMRQDEKVKLSAEIYSVWVLGQQAGFTAERAAQLLGMELEMVEKMLAELENKQLIIFWTGSTLNAFEHYTLTPRGHANARNEKNQQLLLSYSQSKPIAVDKFGHALWMYSNGLVPLNKILMIVASKLDITLQEAYRDSAYWIPYLVRHGLAVLNPVSIEGR